MLALDEALDRFTALEPQQAELVKLRYFVGLKTEEAAEVRGISPPPRTVGGLTPGRGCSMKLTAIANRTAVQVPSNLRALAQSARKNSRNSSARKWCRRRATVWNTPHAESGPIFNFYKGDLIVPVEK